MKKLMIINWRWKNFNDNSSEKIILDKNENCLFISNYDQNNAKSLNEFINNVITKENINEALILSHNNQDSHISIPQNDITLISRENFLMKIREFKGGQEFIYFGDDKVGMIDSDREYTSYEQELKKENFDKVWDWYWNQLELDYQKKKLINLWLPLAIDIQGLSEVENIEKRNSYLNEVKEELNKKENGKSYAETLTEGWNEVKKILLPDDGKQVLEEKYQIKEEEKDKIKFPIEREKDDQGQYKKIQVDTLKQFIEENWKKKDEKLGKENDPKFIPEFLPNWLQAVVDIIDKKISEKTS